MGEGRLSPSQDSHLHARRQRGLSTSCLLFHQTGRTFARRTHGTHLQVGNRWRAKKAVNGGTPVRVNFCGGSTGFAHTCSGRPQAYQIDGCYGIGDSACPDVRESGELRAASTTRRTVASPIRRPRPM